MTGQQPPLARNSHNVPNKAGHVLGDGIAVERGLNNYVLVLQELIDVVAIAGGEHTILEQAVDEFLTQKHCGVVHAK